MGHRRSGPWRRRDFRRLWLAQTVSATGSEVTELALPTLAILALGASPVEVGVLAALPWLAYLVVGLPGGVLVDRLPRRRIMIAADLARAAALAAVPIAVVLGRAGLPLLFGVAAIVGVLGVGAQLASRSYLPEVVDRDDLLPANARLTVGEGAAKALGPAIAGVLIQVVGAPLALLADAASYLLSAAWLAGSGTARSPGVAAGDRGLLAAAWDGVAFVAGHPVLRRVLLINVLGNLGMGMVDGVALLYAYRDLGLGPGLVGIAIGVGSAGFLVSGFAAERLTARLGVGPTLAATSVLYALAPLALLVGPLWAPVAAVVGWRLLYGIAVAPYDVNAASLRQALTPAALQGRAIAAINTVGWGALGLGPLAGGLLAGRIGIEATIAAGAAICLVGAAPAFGRPIIAIRRMPGLAGAGAESPADASPARRAAAVEGVAGGATSSGTPRGKAAAKSRTVSPATIALAAGETAVGSPGHNVGVGPRGADLFAGNGGNDLGSLGEESDFSSVHDGQPGNARVARGSGGSGNGNPHGEGGSDGMRGGPGEDRPFGGTGETARPDMQGTATRDGVAGTDAAPANGRGGPDAPFGAGSPVRPHAAPCAPLRPCQNRPVGSGCFVAPYAARKRAR